MAFPLFSISLMQAHIHTLNSSLHRSAAQLTDLMDDHPSDPMPLESQVYLGYLASQFQRLADVSLAEAERQKGRKAECQPMHKFHHSMPLCFV